jgi:hypothetical protein
MVMKIQTKPRNHAAQGERMTFRPIAVSCLLLIVIISAAAQEAAQRNGTQNKAVAAETAATEARSRKIWEDFRSRNKTALAATLAEGFRGLEEGGDGFFDAKAYLSTVDEFELKGYTLSDYTITPLASGAVLVNYHARYDGVSAGQTSQGNAGFSEIWVRRGGNWKLQYLQETYVK